MLVRVSYEKDPTCAPGITRPRTFYITHRFGAIPLVCCYVCIRLTIIQERCGGYHVYFFIKYHARYTGVARNNIQYITQQVTHIEVL